MSKKTIKIYNIFVKIFITYIFLFKRKKKTELTVFFSHTFKTAHVLPDILLLSSVKPSAY